MKIQRYRLRTVEAVQITEEMFSATHPSELHIPGVRYDPIAYSFFVEYPSMIRRFGRVGDYIIVSESRAVNIISKEYFEREYELAEDESDPFDPKNERSEKDAEEIGSTTS